MHLDLLANPDLPIGELLVVVLAEQPAEQDPGLARPHPFRPDQGDRERADAKIALEPRLLLVRSPGGHPAMPIAPVMIGFFLNEYIRAPSDGPFRLAAVIGYPSCWQVSLSACRWYALPGEGGCLLQSPSRGAVGYGWRYEVL